MFQQQKAPKRGAPNDGERASKHGAGYKGGEATVEKAQHKMLWSLDSRLRHVAGQVPSYFLLEGDTLLIPALEDANKQYDSKRKKGTAHPDGPRRTTLAAAAAFNAMSTADLSAAEGEAKEAIAFYDKMVAMTKSPTIS